MSVSGAKLPTSYPHKRDGPRGFNPALVGTYADDLALTTPPPHRHEVTPVTHEGGPAREHPLMGPFLSPPSIRFLSRLTRITRVYSTNAISFQEVALEH